jgi:acetyltransferase
MATDALFSGGGALAELSSHTIDCLNSLLPPFWSHHNPVDILGDATPDRFAAAAKIVIEDEHVDGLIAILTPQAMTEPTETALQLADAVSKYHKPTLAAWMGGVNVAGGRQVLNQHGIATLNTPEEAVGAFLNMAAYAHGLEVLYETPRPAAVVTRLSSAERRAQVAECLSGRHDLLDEPTTKALLDAYGISNTTPRAAHNLVEVELRAREIGFPLVMKVLSPDITHKSDVGGVRTNINSPAEAAQVYADMLQNVGLRSPTARIDGVTLQPYLAPEHKLELILGSRCDPTFGPVIMVGLGGVATEIFRDCAFELPPLDERLARGMLSRLRIWPLLRGYRGAPPLAVDRLIDTLLRYSMLIVECPEIVECDLNPLLVTPESVTALDARALVRSTLSIDAKAYSRLAIAPYPDEWIRECVLKDGSRVTLRPIRPEDSPLWHKMVDAASDQSILSRFRSQFRSVVHRDAARYCFIDYDREMAFVVETTQTGATELVGIGRLVGDSERDSAEFGALVVDAWQGRGLGAKLLDLCIEFGERAGYRQIYAETGWDNQRMLTLFRKRNFSLTHRDNDATTVRATRLLRS